jgi:hypothetical protein
MVVIDAGAHCLQSLAISGCTVNLVVFLVDVLDEDTASAANAVTNWTGASLLLSVLGATIGDLSSIGHVRTSVICHAIFTAVSRNKKINLDNTHYSPFIKP